ncbi:response regulator transcription factor [Phycicoccus sp. HDW14]|uniref:response regulator transcription factor n=1 Tax=Phycicoccus sp. HDW14 TaxID=2714941 RepID=UPI00140CC71C|nr:response regulator transcription factor [Phycicoccus sp. HDW14]QIM22773.1 response regulator transcription factor [Phycicoccus sp. HDW14]
MTSHPSSTPSRRVVVVEDSELLRQSIVRFLTTAGLQVVAQLGSAEALLAVVAQDRPHVVVLDVRLPPTHTDEGIRAAISLRRAHPAVGVLVLSTYVEGEWARQLFSAGTSATGYLLKDRITEHAFVEAIEHVGDGGTVVDPEVVSLLMAAQRRSEVLSALTDREREVLELMAQGRSNAGIGQALFLSPRTIEAHVASIFAKLPIVLDEPTSNKRVLAVLAYLQEVSPWRRADEDRG